MDLVTKDAYEPRLPLSVVVHIDYMKAPSVIQRFGDVKRLITQTLDPMLSAFFRDVAQKKTMLELLHERDMIQDEAQQVLARRFKEFDIECVAVLIGKPDTAEAGGKIEMLLEQLRIRQLSIEQLETLERQRVATEKQRTLNEAQCLAQKQTELTASEVQIRIAENAGDADLAKVRKYAQQEIVMAQAELEKARHHATQTVVTAEAESRQRSLAGKGESQKLLQVGLSEASVLMQKIGSFGDPRLYALAVVAEHLSKSAQPLVPHFMVGSGGSDGNGASLGGQGLLGTLISLLVAEKTGLKIDGNGSPPAVRELAEKMTQQALVAMRDSSLTDLPPVKGVDPTPEVAAVKAKAAPVK